MFSILYSMSIYKRLPLSLQLLMIYINVTELIFMDICSKISQSEWLYKYSTHFALQHKLISIKSPKVMKKKLEVAGTAKET